MMTSTLETYTRVHFSTGGLDGSGTTDQQDLDGEPPGRPAPVKLFEL